MHMSAFFVGVFTTSVLLVVQNGSMKKGTLVEDYWGRVIFGLLCGLAALDLCWLSRLKRGKENMATVQKNINEASKATGRSYGERRMMGEVAAELLEQTNQESRRLIGQRVAE